jgi:hypothetical protein
MDRMSGKGWQHMKRRRCRRGAWLALALVVAACSSNAPIRRHVPYPLDHVLRLNQVQVLGTHNSYHRRPSSGVPGAWSNYEHPPLDVQLGEEGVRSVELDISNVDGFTVGHDPFFDDRSNCSPLRVCLRALRRWSDQHPGHIPIFVLLDPKDPSPIYDPVRDSWDVDAFDRLDKAVRAVLEPDDLVTPDDVRGDAATLREAVVEEGWPTLEEVRGKFIVVLNRIALRREYIDGHRSLEGRAMFIPAYENAPSAAFIEHDLPVESEIRRLVEKGFIIRTRADADGVEVRAEDHTRSDAAMHSGAQIISTDYPVPDDKISDYVVQFPNKRAARCNPVNAPRRCDTSDIENARGLRRVGSGG